MASNTKNVKLGVCQVFYDGYDLGYTQGGVEVSVKTDTHKVNIDQFGKSTVNELIMGREVTAKVPMAETTVDNMVAIMPGAVLSQSGGSVASGTITITTNPSDGDTILVGGRTITFKTAVTDASWQVAIGANAAATATALQQFLQAHGDPAIGCCGYTVAGAVITVKYGAPLIYGTTGQMIAGTAATQDGNFYPIATGTAGAKVAVVAMSGGADATSKSVDVGTGIGNDLLSLAKELRFHPVGKPTTDRSDDFVIPLAGTAGALQFAYKVENERVYNVDFMGYPDPITQKLFLVGR